MRLPDYAWNQGPEEKTNEINNKFIRRYNRELFTVWNPRSCLWEVWHDNRRRDGGNGFHPIFRDIKHFDGRLASRVWAAGVQPVNEMLADMDKVNSETLRDREHAQQNERDEALDKTMSTATSPKAAKSIISYGGQKNKTKTHVRL